MKTAVNCSVERSVHRPKEEFEVRHNSSSLGIGEASNCERSTP